VRGSRARTAQQQKQYQHAHAHEIVNRFHKIPSLCNNFEFDFA
jgi:hypothetical protein